jgi:hypothetical protein
MSGGSWSKNNAILFLLSKSLPSFWNVETE